MHTQGTLVEFFCNICYFDIFIGFFDFLDFFNFSLKYNYLSIYAGCSWSYRWGGIHISYKTQNLESWCNYYYIWQIFCLIYLENGFGDYRLWKNVSAEISATRVLSPQREFEVFLFFCGIYYLSTTHPQKEILIKHLFHVSVFFTFML